MLNGETKLEARELATDVMLKTAQQGKEIKSFIGDDGQLRLLHGYKFMGVAMEGVPRTPQKRAKPPSIEEMLLSKPTTQNDGEAPIVKSVVSAQGWTEKLCPILQYSSCFFSHETLDGLCAVTVVEQTTYSFRALLFGHTEIRGTATTLKQLNTACWQALSNLGFVIGPDDWSVVPLFAWRPSEHKYRVTIPVKSPTKRFVFAYANEPPPHSFIRMFADCLLQEGDQVQFAGRQKNKLYTLSEWTDGVALRSPIGCTFLLPNLYESIPEAEEYRGTGNETAAVYFIALWSQEYFSRRWSDLLIDCGIQARLLTCSGTEASMIDFSEMGGLSVHLVGLIGECLQLPRNDAAFARHRRDILRSTSATRINLDALLGGTLSLGSRVTVPSIGFGTLRSEVVQKGHVFTLERTDSPSVSVKVANTFRKKVPLIR